MSLENNVELGYVSAYPKKGDAINYLAFSALKDELVDARDYAVRITKATATPTFRNMMPRHADLGDGRQQWIFDHKYFHKTGLNPGMVVAGVSLFNIFATRLLKSSAKGDLEAGQTVKVQTYKADAKDSKVTADVIWPQATNPALIKLTRDYVAPVAYSLRLFKDKDLAETQSQIASNLHFNHVFGMTLSPRSSFKSTEQFAAGKQTRLRGENVLVGAQPIIYLAEAAMIGNADQLLAMEATREQGS